MIFKTQPATFGTWSMRVALFSGALLVFTVLLHRLLGMSTPIALNLFTAGFAGGIVAVLLAVAALVEIWRTGRSGLMSAFGSVAVVLTVFAGPLLFLPTYLNLPALNDVSTDLQSPPPFMTLARLRTGSANGAQYPAERFAKLQATYYPDLRPFAVDRSAEEAHELAVDALKRLKFQIISEEAPGQTPARPGWIEAVDRTPVVGFYDDVIVRVQGDKARARIDVRSASRYGGHDMGRNATRVRRIMKELQARLDATIPAAPGDRISQLRSRHLKAAVPKRLKGVDQKTAARRSGPDRAQSDVQRGPVPKAKPR
jgi:hypothetical protein